MALMMMGLEAILTSSAGVYLERRLSAQKLRRPHRLCIEYNCLFLFLLTSVVTNASGISNIANIQTHVQSQAVYHNCADTTAVIYISSANSQLIYTRADFNFLAAYSPSGARL